MKWIGELFLVFSLLLTGIAGAAPANDNLANAQLLETRAEGLSLEGTNAGATVEPEEISHPDLFTEPFRTVWYRIPSPRVGRSFVFGIYDDEFSATFSIFRGNATGGVTGLVPVAAGFSWNLVEVTVPDATGGDYFVAVDAYWGDGGPFLLELRLLPDVLANARLLQADDSFPTPPASNLPTGAVWYRIKAPPQGASFALSNQSNFSSSMTLYRGHVLNPVAQLQMITGHTSHIGFTVPDGTKLDYFIAVRGQSGATGDVRLSMAATAPPVFPSATPGFPHSSPEPRENFAGGSDPFDLNYRSITFVPHQVVANGHPETHYYHTVRQIRDLPEDLSDEVALDGNVPIHLPLPADFNIFGESAAAISIPAGDTWTGGPLPTEMFPVRDRIRFEGETGVLTPEIRVLDSAVDSFSNYWRYRGLTLNRIFRARLSEEKLTLQFDYHPRGDIVDSAGVTDVTYQVELFAGGMIRISFLEVEITYGNTGLFNGSVFATEADFSTQCVKMPDVVVAETFSATALFRPQLPSASVPAVPLRALTGTGTALPMLDFQSRDSLEQIPAISSFIDIPVAIVSDSIPEAEEFFTLKVVSPTDPNWVFAEAQAWITDTLPPSPSPAPRIELAGNRIFLTLPSDTNDVFTGFRILSVTGGSLRLPSSAAPLPVGAIVTLAQGAEGLIASDLGVSLQVEALNGTGVSLGAVSMDLDGASGAPVFQFQSGSYRVTEGDSVELTVVTSASGSGVSYDFLAGTAQVRGNSSDIVTTPRSLVFRDGRATVSIPVVADGLTEGDETFEVRLVNPTAGSHVGPVAIARVTISDGSGPLLASGLQRFPIEQPSGRTLRMLFNPTDFAGQDFNDSWRLTGETRWRDQNENAFNLRDGLHKVEFRPAAGVAASGYKNPGQLHVSPLFAAPSYYQDQGLNVGVDLDIYYERDRPLTITSPGEGVSSPPVGGLTVVPGLMPAGAQWRRTGETEWRNPSTTETTVPVGKHWIEFKDEVAGHFPPMPQQAIIKSGSNTTVTGIYRLRPATAIFPQLVTEPDLHESGSSWLNVPITEQTGRFQISFEMLPLESTPGSSISTMVGLAPFAVSDASGLSTIARANDGSIDGWKSGAFGADQSATCQPGQWHLVEMEVDVPGNTYHLTVTLPVGSPVRVLDTAGFRTATTELRYLAMQSSAGSHKVRNIRIGDLAHSPAVIPIPVQTKAFEARFLLNFGYSFNVSTPPGFGLSKVKSAAPLQYLASPGYPPNISYGRTGSTIITLQVDPVTGTYSLGYPDRPNDRVSGTLNPGLDEIGYIYFASGSFSIQDMVLPPHEVPPSGPDPANAPEDWLHIPITPQTGRFGLTCEVVTNEERIGSGDLIDGIIGLSDSRVTQWSDVSVALCAKRPGGSGLWQAHTGAPGDGYSHENAVPVVNGERYVVELVVDVQADRFRATVRPEGEPPMVITSDAPFRKNASELRYLTLRNVQGRLAVGNIRSPLPAPEVAPVAFTGMIETQLGFASGVAVADHAVLTTAGPVFDPDKLAFIGEIVWRLPGTRVCPTPNLQNPSSVILVAGYASALLANPDSSSTTDLVDVAVLAFRPLSLPTHDNAPGNGGYSGFAVDQGTATWTHAGTPKLLAGFPVSTVAPENRGKLHHADVSTAGFTTVSNGLHAMSENFPDSPPGFEGASLFVRQANGTYLPSAICLGTESGQLRFRTIDSAVADAIHQANTFQRHPLYFQEPIKGGTYYIPSTVAGTADPDRAHVFADAIPSTATWKLYNYNYPNDEPTTWTGGQGVSVEPDDYYVEFGPPPPGYAFHPDQSYNYPSKPYCLRKILMQKTEWHLPPVYIALPPKTWQEWQARNFSVTELSRNSVIAPEATETFLGVENVIAYAFGFDPKVPKTWPADPATMTPGYPILRRPSPGAPLQLEFLRRRDSGLRYRVEATDDLSGSWPWALEAGYPNTSSSILTGASNDTWEHVRIPLTGLGPDTARKFVRVKVGLTQ